MNFWDVIILILVGAALFGAVRLYRGRKKGACGGCCADCSVCERGTEKEAGEQIVNGSLK